MCCRLQLHVKAHAILSIFGNGLIVLFWMYIWLHPKINEVTVSIGLLEWYLIFIIILVHLFIIWAGILCLIGAIKRKKNFLIPFMVSQVLLVLLFILYSLPFVVALLNLASFFGVIIWFLLLCLLLCIPIHYLHTTVKFYMAIGQRDDSITDECFEEEERISFKNLEKRCSIHSI